MQWVLVLPRGFFLSVLVIKSSTIQAFWPVAVMLFSRLFSFGTEIMPSILVTKSSLRMKLK